MTYDEAKAQHGELITPSIAARILGVSQPAINDYCKRNVLTKIKAELGGITKTYVSLLEVNKYKTKREDNKTPKSDKNDLKFSK